MSTIPSRVDLWAQAIGRLKEEDKKLIDVSSSNKLSILSELETLSKQSLKECEDRQWKVKRKTGEVVNLRDLFTKLIKWVNKFKQIGDSLAQADPAHVALPWACINFLLQVVLRDGKTYGFMVEAIERIAQIICRYTLFEAIYLDTGFSTSQKLEAALVHLYTSLLEILAHSRHYFQQNAAKRFASSILSSDKIDDMFTTVDIAKDSVEQYARLMDAERSKIAFNAQKQEAQVHSEELSDLKHILNSLDEPVNRMDENIRLIRDDLDDTKRRQVLNWFSQQPFIQHHENSKREVLPGTGIWFLTDHLFRNWLRESVSSILWLRGMPGSGKSKITSLVIEEVQKLAAAGRSHWPAYFYCSRNSAEPERSEPCAILASIAKQLSQPQPGDPLLKAALDVYHDREKKNFASGSLNIEENTELIIQLSNCYPSTVIILDALDECKPMVRLDLLDSLQEILQQSSSLVKIFVSSRDDQDLVCELKDYPNVAISSDRNGADLEHYIRTTAETLIRKKRLLRHSKQKEKMKQLIVEKLSQGAGGMFRWATLQYEALCTITVDAQIEERVGKLPRTLNHLYREILEGFSQDGIERTIINMVLSWLLCAVRTMGSTELISVISSQCDPGHEELSRDQVLALCHNLVEYDASLDIFRFCHLSVREFLEDLGPDFLGFAHVTLSKMCLVHLDRYSSIPSSPEISILMSWKSLTHGIGLISDPESHGNIFKDSFTEYSTLHWASHAQSSSLDRREQVLHPILRARMFGDGSPNLFDFWVRFVFLLDQVGHMSIPHRLSLSTRSPFHLASCFGLSEIFEWTSTKRRNICWSARRLFALASKFADPKTAFCVLELGNLEENLSLLKEGYNAAISGGNIFQLDFLLQRKNGKLQRECTHDELLIPAVRSSTAIFTLIFRAIKPRELSERFLRAVIDYGQHDVIDLCLNECPSVRFTSQMLEEAARRPEILQLILKSTKSLTITDKVFASAVSVYIDASFTVQTILAYDSSYQVSSELLNMAATKNNGAFETILEQRKQLPITASIVETIAYREINAATAIRLLLELYPTIEVTERALQNAVIRPQNGALDILLNGERHVQVPTHIVDYVACETRLEKTLVMEKLLKCDKTVIITKRALEAAKGKTLEAILKHRKGLEITIEKVEMIAASHGDNASTMEMLLEYGTNTPITARAVKLASFKTNGTLEVMVRYRTEFSAPRMLIEKISELDHDYDENLSDLPGLDESLAREFKILLGLARNRLGRIGSDILASAATQLPLALKLVLISAAAGNNAFFDILMRGFECQSCINGLGTDLKSQCFGMLELAVKEDREILRMLFEYLFEARDQECFLEFSKPDDIPLPIVIGALQNLDAISDMSSKFRTSDLAKSIDEKIMQYRQHPMLSISLYQNLTLDLAGLIAEIVDLATGSHASDLYPYRSIIPPSMFSIPSLESCLARRFEVDIVSKVNPAVTTRLIRCGLLQVTESLIMATARAQRYGAEVFEYIATFCGVKSVSEEFLRTATKVWTSEAILGLLIENDMVEYEDFDQALHSAAQHGGNRCTFAALLTAQPDTNISPRVIDALLTNKSGDPLKFFLSSFPDFLLPQAALNTAARYSYLAFEALLRSRPLPDFDPTVFEDALANKEGSKVIECIFKHYPQTKVSKNILSQAASICMTGASPQSFAAILKFEIEEDVLPEILEQALSESMNYLPPSAKAHLALGNSKLRESQLVSDFSVTALIDETVAAGFIASITPKVIETALTSAILKGHRNLTSTGRSLIDRGLLDHRWRKTVTQDVVIHLIRLQNSNITRHILEAGCLDESWQASLTTTDIGEFMNGRDLEMIEYILERGLDRHWRASHAQAAPIVAKSQDDGKIKMALRRAGYEPSDPKKRALSQLNELQLPNIPSGHRQLIDQLARPRSATESQQLNGSVHGHK